MTTTEVLDVEQAADEAGLRYVSDAEPGIRRVRRGRGFSYHAPDGSVLNGSVRKRITSLVIPPAWKDVWICRDRNGHLQATGRDDRGRKVYLYHPEWRRVRDAHKFAQLAAFGAALPDLRAQVSADLGLRGMTRRRIVALVVRLLDDSLVRVGNVEYEADNETYGLTTLRRRHVTVSGSKIVFEFVGKSGVEHDVSVSDRRLAEMVRRCHELNGKHLFSYVDDDGAVCDVGSADVNDYLRSVIGDSTSAKDFRTWGASALMAGTLGAAGPPVNEADAEAAVIDAYDQAALALGNTRAVVRSSYVHPKVPESYHEGSLADAWRRARGGERMDRSERALLRVLDHR
jgi:DNA topoisomerase-1